MIKKFLYTLIIIMIIPFIYNYSYCIEAIEEQETQITNNVQENKWKVFRNNQDQNLDFNNQQQMQSESQEGELLASEELSEEYNDGDNKDSDDETLEDENPGEFGSGEDDEELEESEDEEIKEEFIEEDEEEDEEEIPQDIQVSNSNIPHAGDDKNFILIGVTFLAVIITISLGIKYKEYADVKSK